MYIIKIFVLFFVLRNCGSAAHCCRRAMAGKKAAKLRIVFNENSAKKSILPDGVAESLDDILEAIRHAFGFKTGIRLQYLDMEFGAYLNLTSTSDIGDLSVVNVIPMTINMSGLSSSPSTPMTLKSPCPLRPPLTLLVRYLYSHLSVAKKTPFRLLMPMTP
ncbi:hypothetical protein UPYG_G00223220 [Umbra pygmaea]|uniref:PB1 domain-containing protein n=1 Tax=Umbra pygmaea TaxID=75934 RepID=A0ABD0WH80_UMBPY